MPTNLTERKKKHYRKGDLSYETKERDADKVHGIFKDRSLMVDQTLFELPFAHPRDMKLLYQKYGLN